MIGCGPAKTDADGSMKRIVLFILGVLFAPCTALAQSTATPSQMGYLTNSGCYPGQTVCFAQYGATIPFSGSVAPTNSSGAFTAVTVGTSSSSAIAAAACKVYCAIYNNSQTATICINFTSAATITGTVCAAGEITLPPQWHQSWEGSYVPSDAINVIASAASTPATAGAK